MAIKVNGTTVINDSRALQNIASVDSATVTALGNAGVGGGETTLVNADVSVSQAATLLLPVGNYRINRYVLEGLQTQHFFGDIMHWRMSNSSGTTITSSDYIAVQGQEGTTNRWYTSMSYIDHDFNFDVPSTSQSGTGSGWYGEVTVFNGYSSSKRTVVHVTCSSSKEEASSFQWTMSTTQRNQHVVCYIQQGNNFTATGSYTHWGIS